MKYNTKEFFYDTSFDDYKAPLPIIKNMKTYYILKAISIIFTSITVIILLFNYDTSNFDLYNIALPLWQWILVLPFFYFVNTFLFQLLHKAVFKNFDIKYTTSAGPR